MPPRPVERGADAVLIEGTCAVTCSSFNSAAKVKVRFMPQKDRKDEESDFPGNGGRRVDF